MDFRASQSYSGLPHRWPVLLKASGGTPATTLGDKSSFQLKQLGMRPDIGTVITNKDRNIADDTDASFGAVGPQSAPLLKEGKLKEAFFIELPLQLGSQFGDYLRIAADDFFRPCIPGLFAKALA